MKQIVPGLYYFTGLILGHAYLITEGDGLTIIDASIPGAAPKIVAQLKTAGYQPSDVKRILITHAHFDHVGGLPELARLTGAPVICSAVEKPQVSDSAPIVPPKPESIPAWQRFMVNNNQVMKPTPVARTLSDGEIMPEVFGGLQAVAAPGHSPGHTAFWQPERRIIIMGDVLFNAPWMMLPFPAFTTDMAENIRSLKKIAAMDVETACFGHGSPIVSGAAAKLRAFAAKF